MFFQTSISRLLSTLFLAAAAAVVFSLSASLAQAATIDVTLTSPNGGECWRSGYQTTVTWTVEGDLNAPSPYHYYFHLALINEAGNKWWVFADNINKNTRSFTWNAPSANFLRIDEELDPDRVKVEVVLWGEHQELFRKDLIDKDASDGTIRVATDCTGASPSPSPTRSPSPSPTGTRSPSPSPTGTRSPSPSPTATRSPSPGATQPGGGIIPGGGGGLEDQPRFKPGREGVCPWWRSIFGLCAPEEVVCPLWQWIFGSCPPPGLTDDEEEEEDITPPGAPGGIQAISISDTSTTIGWNAPTTTTPGGGGGGATQPSPTRSPSPSPTGTRSPSPSPSPDIRRSPLPLPTQPTLPPTPTPSPTRDFEGPPHAYSRFLALAAGEGDVLGYRVFRDGTLVGETRGLRFTDKGLTPNTTYRYWVQACDRAGNLSPFSNQITIKTKSSFFGQLLLGPRTPKKPAKVCPGG